MSHEEAPRSHDAQMMVVPLDAPVVVPLDAAVVVPLDAPVVVPLDAAVVAPLDARRVDAQPPVDAGVVKKQPKVGKLGDVCAKGSRSQDLDDGPTSRPVLTCGPGLMCCYPCGIPGCDSVCKKTCPAVP
jgi:hypothetical protein